MRYLVTGAAGFIGSHLCERLIGRGDQVIGLDNFDAFYDRRIKESNIKTLLESGPFKLFEGDIRDSQCVRSVFKEGFDAIVHLAAKAGVQPSLADPIGYMDVNVNGTVVLLEAAKTFEIKKFIFGSSSSVYGNNDKIPFSEDDNVDFPISPYAASKKAGELMAHTYHHLYGMNVTCLRFFTVYGPRQRPDLAIHKFVRLIEKKQPILIYGDGSMMRDFTYIEDIIDGTVAAIDRCRGYEIYNLGESKPIRLDVLICEIENVLGKNASISRSSIPPGDVKQTFADISKATAELGYHPNTEISEGLKLFVRWFRDQRVVE